MEHHLTAHGVAVTQRRSDRDRGKLTSIPTSQHDTSTHCAGDTALHCCVESECESVAPAA